jgi:hypothetical protein
MKHIGQYCSNPLVIILKGSYRAGRNRRGRIKQWFNTKLNSLLKNTTKRQPWQSLKLLCTYMKILGKNKKLKGVRWWDLKVYLKRLTCVKNLDISITSQKKISIRSHAQNLIASNIVQNPSSWNNSFSILIQSLVPIFLFCLGGLPSELWGTCFRWIFSIWYLLTKFIPSCGHHAKLL